MTHFYVFEKKKIEEQEEPPVCVACDTIITVKHVFTECADLVEVRKKYSEDRSLYLLFQNVKPETISDFFRKKKIGVFHRLRGVVEIFV